LPANVSTKNTVYNVTVGKRRRAIKLHAPFIYRDGVVGLILRLKYNGEGDIAKLFAPYMWTTVKSAGKQDLIVPVPLSAERYKMRGYNQSAWLANEIARVMRGAGVKPPPVVDALVRVKKTEVQKNMSKKQREENMKGAFAMNASLRGVDNIKDKHILLIDDVFTTGATAAECARVLFKNGAQSVNVLTIARAGE